MTNGCADFSAGRGEGAQELSSCFALALIRSQASRINVGPDPDTLGELDWEVPSELPVLGPPRSAASWQSPFHQPGMCTGWSDSGLSESDKHTS